MIRLRELRKEKRVSQNRIAMEINSSQSAVSAFELGQYEPDITSLKILADYFNVSIDYLVGHSDKKRAYSEADLSVDESDILHDYKLLTSNQKEIARAYIKGMLGRLHD